MFSFLTQKAYGNSFRFGKRYRSQFIIFNTSQLFPKNTIAILVNHGDNHFPSVPSKNIYMYLYI